MDGQGETLSERLLNAWVKLTGILKNNRITKGLSYNESVVMLFAYNKYRKGEMASFKEIVAGTNMLKSLANRTVNSLEKKGLIERCTGEKDKRTVYIRCVEEKLNVFLEVHANSLLLAEHVAGVIGTEDAEALIRIADKVEAAARER